MGINTADAARDVFYLNLGYGEIADEPDFSGSNDSNHSGAITPTHSDPPPPRLLSQIARGNSSLSQGQRPARSNPLFEKLHPVRLGSTGDIGGAMRLSSNGDVGSMSVGSIIHTPRSGRVDNRVTAKSPAWCDRQTAGTPQKPSVPPRGRSPTGGVVRRSSAPGVGISTPSRFPASPQAGTPGASMTLPPHVARDPGNVSSVKGDVSLYVRLRPGSNEEIVAVPEGLNGLRLRQPQALRTDGSDAMYHYDHTFGQEASQEDVYRQAVTPICDAVIRGYNGAVCAYGQTGSGKTHTMLGTSRCKGIAPRAVEELFSVLETRPNWMVEVSVLEIYNERVRDLLAPGTTPTHVDVHEHCSADQHISFRCPDATKLKCTTPDEAIAALSEGMKRRETARTDMNHTSSRSHLIFTLCTTQREHDIGATLRGRLHLVDLAGSERLKRSMSSERNSFRATSQTPRTPRDQRREAGEINKSLSQLALVIQRLTGSTNSSMQYIPYRDSMLTRLLAESFGGSSKTCLIITASALAKDREETRSSLEFGKRAKLVKNKAEINLEVTHAPTAIMQAMVQQKVTELELEKQMMIRERDMILADCQVLRKKVCHAQVMVKEAAGDAVNQQHIRVEDARQHENEKALLQQRTAETLSSAHEAHMELADQVADLQNIRIQLHGLLVEGASEISRLKQEATSVAREHEEDMEHAKQLDAERAKQLETQRAQTAAFRAESAALRDRWLEDVTRLEAEKAELAQKADEEKAALRKRLADVMAVLSNQQENQAAARLGSAAIVEEATAAAQKAEAEGASIKAQSLERLAASRQHLESVLTETATSEQLRKARLTDLEAEHLELKHKWRLTLESFAESASAPQEAEIQTAASDAPQCLPSQSDAFPAGQVTDDPIAVNMWPQAATPVKSCSWELLDSHSPDADMIPTSTLSLHGNGDRGPLAVEVESSDEPPFSGFKMGTLNI